MEKEKQMIDTYQLPFGYKVSDGGLEMQKKHMAVVVWIYQKQQEYMENPPDILLMRVKDYCDCKGIEIGNQDLKEYLSVALVKQYLVDELNILKKRWKDREEEISQEEVEELLERPMMEAERLQLSTHYRNPDEMQELLPQKAHTYVVYQR